MRRGAVRLQPSSTLRTHALPLFLLLANSCVRTRAALDGAARQADGVLQCSGAVPSATMGFSQHEVTLPAFKRGSHLVTQHVRSLDDVLK
jgi:hypothetical protein